MSRNVYEVSTTLIVDPNQPVLGPGLQLKDLGPGQIGVFSAETNLSIDATSANARGFYLAVGLPGCNGEVSGVKHSAGQYHQCRNMYYYTFRCYTPYQPKVFELTDLNPACETEYQIKLMLRSPNSLYNQGARPLSKNYAAVTSCCESCGCPSGNCLDLAVKLAKDIAMDEDNLIDIKLIPSADATPTLPDGTADPTAVINTANEIDPLDDAAINAFIAANTDADGVPTDCLGLRFYSKVDKCMSFLRYTI